ncbi:hypothetical protein AWJ20_3110 [Sugiyamaella lignohabitans]|uniref:GST C-terminal domain-containing protein n=1 Tax=Sugiyamaella lignohabitans TaxID=796027 RepID=A0A167FMJ0_9ASCO|nr:uncharacterized protein AWJ20_3110 [Sugiyamaella lignohabitans]ANB15482.1 hypothetical protein AWJ20_3110 [Sugiyamaella lignohabitans]
MSIWTIPEPVRKVFDSFPLKVNEPTKLPLNGNDAGMAVSKGLTHVYVYNIAENGLCTDPHCLEVQSWIQLRNKQNKTESDKITISASSVHVSPTDSLPFIVENSHKINNIKPQSTKSEPVGRVKYLQDKGNSSSNEEVYCSLIDTWLRSCWIVSMLDPRHLAIKESIYILEEERKELPTQILSVISNQVNYRLIQELEPQYPELTAEANSYRARITGYSLNSNILADVFDRAEECLAVFESLLSKNKSQAIFGDLNGGTDLGRLDILLFSYTHLILWLIPNSQLARLIPPLVRAHSEHVYNKIFC